MTNFERVTESPEALANWLFDDLDLYETINCSYCPATELCHSTATCAETFVILFNQESEG